MEKANSSPYFLTYMPNCSLRADWAINTSSSRGFRCYILPRVVANNDLPPARQGSQDPTQVPSYLRRENHPTAAAHDLFEDLLSHCFGVVPRVQERRRVVDALGQASAHPAWTNTDGPYLRGIVAHLQFGSQTFMQGDGCGFGAGIGNYVWRWS